ncbi:hypothetical protein INS49_008897 [Diaporthe citri]|uniref:uncharacterized protein n=1 Tax=Diaporthe citri TaxID=83186 RepID=UPI001C81F074|nr:uncharacterized protein INS49_008897 [Diaporthe citri]KAG6363794.1 hypothetical protein INS49_008897 [Diaporthe citri]
MTVTSYNWLDRAKPTIVVPGKPAKWTPLVEPRQLKPDDGQYFRDPNAAHHPKHPMEPTVLAVLAQNTRDIDVVACGSTLGNLLRFIRGEDKLFRFLVELVEGAVFFVRRENTPHELIPDVKGYGHSFPEAYTTWELDVKGSVSHQRVLSYRFGGLSFLVRFEGDGYILAESKDEKDGHAMSFQATEGKPKGAVERSAVALDQSRVTASAPSAASELTMSPAGKLVDQEHIFDLKTRSIRRKEAATFEDTFADQLPRLWVSQVPNFILAYHDRGKFEDITVKDAQKDVKAWERGQARVLSRLAALIHHIVGLVKSRPDGKLELRHARAGSLEVREQLEDAGDALSDAVKLEIANVSESVGTDEQSFIMSKAESTIEKLSGAADSADSQASGDRPPSPPRDSSGIAATAMYLTAIYSSNLLHTAFTKAAAAAAAALQRLEAMPVVSQS